MGMKKSPGFLAAAAVAILLAVASAGVGAHHAFSAEFDVNKPLELTGTLVKWEMINPHSWFHIDVEDSDGARAPGWSRVEARTSSSDKASR